MYRLPRFHTTVKPSAQIQGFTLPELLVAAAISLGVVSLGGFGLVAILTSSQTANAQNERRTELDRSLDFIATEVRQAEKLEKNVATATKPNDFNTGLPTGAAPVLMLYPKIGGVPVIYYLASSTNNTWRGPKVVYRWGPSIDSDGEYIDANVPANWEHEPLIDRIEDTGTLPSCPPGWTGTGTSSFLSCVNDTGSLAKLYKQGSVVKALGPNEIYAADATVATRPTYATVPAPSTSSGATSDRIFSVTDGTVTFTNDANISINVVGGQVTCGVSGPAIPTNATVNFVFPSSAPESMTINPGDPTYTRSVPRNTTLTITGNLLDNASDSCGDTTLSYFSNLNEWNSAALKQVITLFNGDTSPSFQPYGGQASITSFLEDAEVLEGPDDTTLQLNDNQVVFLYELGVEYDSNYTNNSAFDMQDVVVEAEISPI